MSQQEMMKRLAEQKRERGKLAQRLSRIEEQLAAVVEMLNTHLVNLEAKTVQDETPSGVVQGMSETLDQMSASLDAIGREVATLQHSEHPVTLSELKKEVEKWNKTMMGELGPNVERLLEAAEAKETRAEKRLKELEGFAADARRNSKEAEELMRKIKKLEPHLKDFPRRIQSAAESATKTLQTARRKRWLRHLLQTALVVVMTTMLLLALGWWGLTSQNLEMSMQPTNRPGMPPPSKMKTPPTEPLPKTEPSTSETTK